MTTDLSETANKYINEHGDDATFIIRADISRAIAASDWTEVHRLQRAQLRVSRLQYCEQMAQQLSAQKRNSYR